MNPLPHPPTGSLPLALSCQVALLKEELLAMEMKLVTTQKRDAADLGVLRDDYRRLEDRLEAEKRDKNLVEVRR